MCFDSHRRFYNVHSHQTNWSPLAFEQPETLEICLRQPRLGAGMYAVVRKGRYLDRIASRLPGQPFSIDEARAIVGIQEAKFAGSELPSINSERPSWEAKNVIVEVESPQIV